MKTKNLCIALVLLMLPTAAAIAQNTAFTYQGRLIDNGARANGNYDLTFAIFDAGADGTQINATLTNSSVVVSNGLFTTQLDFGADIFTNSPLWLEIGERANGGGNFTTLSPRQQLTAVPYAISAGNLTGSLPASQLSGPISLTQLPSAILTNGASGVNISGTFSGDGSTLTNIALAGLDSHGGLTLASNSIAFLFSATIPVGQEPFWVVAADVNGDGKPDLISANGYDDTLTVLTNDGSGNFLPASTDAVGNTPYFVLATNLFGEDAPDLVSVNNGDNTLTVLTNSGGGTFGFSTTLPVGLYPVAVAAADVNGDGSLDLISVNSGDNTVTVLTNNGSAFFPASTNAVGNDPASVAAADVNGDGKPDLITADYYDNTLTVLTNNGDGTFTFAFTISVGNGPIFVAAANVNGDTNVDLISVNQYDDTVTVLTNNGDGTFTPASTNDVGISPFSVSVADVNGDGIPDLVCANYYYLDNTLSVLLGNGDGTFTEDASSPYAVGTAPATAAVADINGDGKPDLISVSEYDDTLTVLTNSLGTVIYTTQFSGNGSGLTSLNASNLTSGTISDSVLPPDALLFSGLLQSYGYLPYYILDPGLALLDGCQTFSGANNFCNPRNSFTGTFNGNGAGVTNVSFSSIGNNPFTLGLETLGTNFPTVYTVGKQPLMIIAADVNGDSNVDLISANSGDNTLTVLTNNGSGVFGSSAAYSVGSQPLCVAAADVNGDGKLDLISANSGDNTLTILTNNGFGIFGSNAAINVGGICESVAAVDVNGDGNPDLITANHSANSATVFTNDGFGNFSSNATYSVGGTTPVEVVTADVNGDGKPDLIFGNFDSVNTVTVLTNDGSGHFAFCSSYGSGGDLIDITTADMNGDGKPDLIFTDTSGEITVATNDGSGHFTDTLPDEDENASGYYSFADIDFVTTADANGDGKPDLIAIADDGEDFYLGIITNDGSANFTFAFSEKIGAIGSSDPNWIASADVNGDGKMDFAVSDFNSNSVAVLAGDGNSVSVLPPAPQVEQAQVVIVSGEIAFTNSQNNFTGAFTGDGGGLTNLNAAQITSGTFSAAQLPDISQLNGTLSTAQLPSAVVTNNESGVALGGVNVNGNMKITGGLAIDASATDAGVVSSNTSLLFGGPDSGEGIGSERVTNGPAKQYSLDFYTSSSQRMTVLLNGNVGIGTNTPATLLDVAGSIHAAGTFIGNGSGLTNLNASQISSGMISAAQLPSGVVTNNESGVALGGTFSGNGSGLTNLNASQISSGTFSGNGSGLTNTVTSGNYLFAYSTQQQSIEDNGVFEAITFGHRPSINGWTYSSSGSFTNAQTGLYLIQYDAVAEESYAVPSAVTLDMTVNGAEIPGSQITTTLTVLNHAFFVSKSFIASLNSGDVAQLRFLGDDASLYLQNGLGNGTNDPSATLTITRLQ